MMKSAMVTAQLLKALQMSCEGCQYEWVPRVEHPKKCPRCGCRLEDRGACLVTVTDHLHHDELRSMGNVAKEEDIREEKREDIRKEERREIRKIEEEKKKERKEPNPAHATVEWVVENWNLIEGVMPFRGEATPTSRIRIGARIKEHLLKVWWDEEFFPRIRQSEFIRGKKTDWCATLGWACGPRNMEKILEDRYRGSGSQPQEQESAATRMRRELLATRPS